MKIDITTTAISSATTTESQMPITLFSGLLKQSGSKNTAPIWKTSVLNTEMSAEIGPFPSAVKKDEPKMQNPERMNEKENIRNQNGRSDGK